MLVILYFEWTDDNKASFLNPPMIGVQHQTLPENNIRQIPNKNSNPGRSQRYCLNLGSSSSREVYHYHELAVAAENRFQDRMTEFLCLL